MLALGLNLLITSHLSARVIPVLFYRKFEPAHFAHQTCASQRGVTNKEFSFRFISHQGGRLCERVGGDVAKW